MEDQANRPHRKPKAKKKHTGGLSRRIRQKAQDTDFPVDHNPKAFAFAKPGRLHKAAARSHDVCKFFF
jgi:ribosome biogenesis protein BMS1